MYIVIISLIVIAAILLILAVLIQNPKGGGIASNFSAGNAIMGVRRTSEFIEKLTWGLAIAIIVLSLSSNMFVSTGGSADEGAKSAISEEAENADIPSMPSLPPGGANQNTPPAER
jgi:preprotein translocase subunit SecG